MGTRCKYQFCAFLLAQLKFSKGFIHGVDLTAFFEKRNVRDGDEKLGIEKK